MTVRQTDSITLRTEKDQTGLSIDPGQLEKPFHLNEQSTLRRKKLKSPISIWDSARSVTPTMAEYWANLVANRQMWHEAGVNAEQLADQCRQTMQILLGVDEGGLQILDEAVCAEVSMPFLDIEAHAARTFPWEFVIANATRPKRGNLPSTVIVRHLQVDGMVVAPLPDPPSSFCFVESAPNPFNRLYGFDLEYVSIQKSLGLTDDTFVKLCNPRRSQLKSKLAEKHWDAIHLTGFDVHQGAEILKAHRWEESSPLMRAYDNATQLTDGRITRPPDGMVILNELQQLEGMPARELAQTLNKPRLVTMNLYNSAGNLAPWAVAEGAQAAIGFQDTFDDSLTDNFFATFYQGWKLGEWQLLLAFAYALQELLPVAAAAHTRADLGVVLWTRDSLLKGGI